MMIIMTGHHRVAFVLVVIAAAYSIAGDFWAAPRYGAIGVAVATSSVLAADNVVTTLVVKRLVGIWVFPRSP
jgi:O-antigen/teichoic acid export membrane protein